MEEADRGEHSLDPFTKAEYFLRWYFAAVYAHPDTSIRTGVSPVLTIFNENLSGRWTLQMSRLPQPNELPVTRQQIW
jgi:hypothetical protein